MRPNEHSSRRDKAGHPYIIRPPLCLCIRSFFLIQEIWRWDALKPGRAACGLNETGECSSVSLKRGHKGPFFVLCSFEMQLEPFCHTDMQVSSTFSACFVMDCAIFRGLCYSDVSWFFLWIFILLNWVYFLMFETTFLDQFMIAHSRNTCELKCSSFKCTTAWNFFPNICLYIDSHTRCLLYNHSKSIILYKHFVKTHHEYLPYIICIRRSFI